MPGLIAGTETLKEGTATSTGTPVTPHSVTSLKNATATPVEDQDSVQSGYRSACGVIAAAGEMTRPSYSWGLGRGQAADAPSPCGELLTPACLSPTVVLSAGVAAISLFVLSRLCVRGRLHPLGLLTVVKESLLLSDRKTSHF